MSNFYSKEELKEIGFKSFGEDVLVSKKASIYGAENISLGNHVRIDDFCILSGKIDIGNYVHISAYDALFGGDAGISIGDYVAVSSRIAVYAVTDDYTGEDVYNAWQKSKLRRFANKMFVVFSISVTINLITPTTEEVYLIYGVGSTIDYIQDNPKAKQLPDKCIDALSRWVDNINKEEKK